MRLVLKMSMSLDGFVAGPNGEMDWWMRTQNPAGAAWVAETIRAAGVHAMGSRTYDGMVGFWPASTDPLAAAMNEIPKVVFTRRADFDPAANPAAAGTTWAESEVCRGDLATEIARLKARPGRDIVAHGGASFARSLTRTGLIDEYRLIVHPVALGAGLAIFTELPEPLDLKLESATPFPSGAVAYVYRPASAAEAAP